MKKKFPVENPLVISLIIVVIATLARLLYFSLDKASPLFLHPILDETEFLRIGKHIAENGPFYPYHFLHPPLYSYFLGILTAIGLSLKGIVIVQFMLGILASGILYLALIKINKTAALITALIWAIYPLELFVESKFLSENLYIFLSISLIYVLLQVKHKWLNIILSAVITGLLIITKTQFLLFFIAWFFLLIFRFKESRKYVLTFAAIGLLFPFFIVVHNYAKTDGKLISVSSNGPMNLYIGNSNDIHETLNIRPSKWSEDFFPSLYDEAGVQFFRNETDPNETYPYLINSFLLKKTWKDNLKLGVPLKNIFLKTLATFHASETPRNYDLYEYKKFNSYLNNSISGKFIFFPLILFMYAALIYVFVKRKQIIRDNSLLVFLVLLIAHLLPSILFFNAFRYRLTAVPIIIFFAILFYQEFGKDFKKQTVHIVLILLLGTSISSGMLVQHIPKHESYDTFADGFLEKGKTKTADKYYNKALAIMEKEDPEAAEHSRTFEQKALLAEKEGDYQKAITYLDQAIEAGQNTMLNFYNRASLKYKKGDFQGALADYTQALQLEKFDLKKLSSTWYGMGITHIKLQDYDAAMNDFTQAIITDSSNGKAWANRGILKGQLGDFINALADLNTSIDIEPGYDKAYCNRGIAYLTLGQPNQALPDFNIALEINPNYAQVYFLRAMTNLDIGQKEGTCDDLRRAYQMGFQAAGQEIEKHCE